MNNNGGSLIIIIIINIIMIIVDFSRHRREGKTNEKFNFQMNQREKQKKRRNGTHIIQFFFFLCSHIMCFP